MNVFKTLFKQTFIYGLATVLPRMLTFLLLPLYTGVLEEEVYGNVSIIYAWFAIANVFLAYGMETAFFRFFNKEKDKNKVVNTSASTIIITSLLFLVIAFIAKDSLANMLQIKAEYVQLAIWTLFLDALVIIPFAWLRAKEKPIRYAVIKIFNVVISLGLNLFFLLALENLNKKASFFERIYIDNFEINYILIANVIASGITVLLMFPFYSKIKLSIDKALLKKMFNYGFPILIAGIAYTINEVADRIFLQNLLPEDSAEAQVGVYSACYKLALFMTLFASAYRLGIEPYFFSHSNTKKPQKNYAFILEYFVVFGSIILLSVVVFADGLKVLIIKDAVYWEAMTIVPIILLASFCLGIYHNLSVWYKVTDKTKYGAYISVCGAIITIILNVVLIEPLGYLGSAIATLATYATMMLLSFCLGKKHYPIPYNIKKIGFYMSISIILSALSFYVYREHYYVGVTFLLGFLVLVYVLEKKQFILHFR